MTASNFRPVSDRALVAGCITSIMDVESKSATSAPSWPAFPHHTTRVGQLLALQVGEAMTVDGGVNELIARAKPTGRVFRATKRSGHTWIIEHVR